MKPYKEFRPTSLDCRGLGLSEQQNWLVLGVAHNRDSGPLEESNFACALKELGGESDDVEVHRFGHWGPGWFEIILINPNSPEHVKLATEIEASLENYPVLDEQDFSEREQQEANDIWRNCYRATERVKYIREHRSQFEFFDFREMLGCVRGNYFCGYASELIG